jgi:murein DD-endopeptidase MepM/ murein hydrolase activator NlpD
VRLALALGLLLSAASPSFAVTLDLTGTPIQGGLMIGKTEAGARVTLDGRALRVSPEGDFLVGFARDAAGTQIVMATGRDGTTQSQVLTVKTRSYDIQRIDGLPERQVTPTPEDLVRIQAEARDMKEARAPSVELALYRSGFEQPADGVISGVYGSQRILNGEARAPHYGLDIAAPDGTPVRAAADGMIAFAHPGMYFNGRTLVIDHGLGLQSVYLHLSEISVSPGTRVAKGEIVGRIGATGRVTAAHLHWGLQLGATWLDPALVLPSKP